jgi:uncharacterized delta-60 repeat protein
MKRLLLSLLALCWLPLLLSAQQPGGVEFGFDAKIAASTGGTRIVYAAVVQPDGKIILGGSFDSVGGLTRNNLVRLYANGAVDPTFNSGAGPNGTVRSIALQPDGKVVIGGDFSSFNGVAATRVARLNPDGSLENPANFNPGTGANATVLGLCVQPDGKILVAGSFQTFNGSTRNRIARLLPDGTLESSTTFNAGTGAAATVNTLALQEDGKILLGGTFTTFNGQSRSRVARLNGDGTLEGTGTFNPGSGPNNNVNCLLVQPDGKILLGGTFTTVNGQARASLARLNPDGSIESTSTFDIGSGSTSVFAMTLQADGKIVLAGGFTSFNGQGRSRAARLLSNGTLEPSSSFDIGDSPDVGFNCMLQPDGRILLLGNFGGVNGVTINFVARLINDAAPQTLRVFGRDLLQWSRAGSAPEVGRVTFELSVNGGADWSLLGPGTRTDGGWERRGLALPASGLLRARGFINSGQAGASGFFVEQILPFTADVVTQPPTLLAPSAGTLAAQALSVSYVLPETAADGSVLLSFSGVGLPRLLTLALAHETAGAHAFTFEPANPMASAAFATAEPLPDGTYTVKLLYRDRAGNPVVSSALASPVVLDATAPDLNLPAPIVAEAGGKNGVAVNFAVSANDAIDPAPFLHVSPASGTVFPLGVTTVGVTARDAAGNTRASSFTVEVRDSTAPVVLAPPAPAALTTGVGGTVSLPDYRPDAAATDALGVASLAQDPPAGTLVLPGVTTVTITATDAAGNVGTTSFAVAVGDGTAPAIAAPDAGFAPLTLNAGAAGVAALPDYTAQALVTDNVAATVSQFPAQNTLLAPGVSQVTLTATDAAGNASGINFNVLVVDLVTPTIAAPPEGFTPVTLTTGAEGNIALPDYTAQAVTADNVGVTGVTQQPPVGSLRLAGQTQVTLTVRDAAGNAAECQFDVAVADGTPPAIAAPVGGFTPLVIPAEPDGRAPVPDFLAQAVITDNVGLASTAQTPAAGTLRPFGKSTILLTAQDVAGNSQQFSLELFVSLPKPLVTAAASSGALVPGQGIDPRLPADSKFTTFGLPSVSDAGELAYLATWKNPGGAGTGIFAGDPALLLVAKDEPAPGADGATFKTFYDPVIAPGGAVAFLASLRGSGIKATNDQGVWVTSPAGLVLALREGSTFPGLPAGVILKTITGISLRDGELLAQATLAPARGLVTPANDSVLLSFTPAGGSVLLREGLPVAGLQGAIASYETLRPAPGSGAQGRWHSDLGGIARLALPGKRSAIAQFATDGSVLSVLETGAAAPTAGPTAYWAALGLPATITTGAGLVVRGTIKSIARPPDPEAVTAKNDSVLALGTGGAFTIFAREGTPAPDAGAATYAAFLDPLINDAQRIAFTATLAGKGLTAKSNTAIFWGVPGAPVLLAQSGSPAPDASGAATTASWGRFISLALPDGPGGGPIFLATLSGAGVTAKNNLGVWAADSAGQLRCLMRTGDIIDGQPVTGIHALAGTSGSLGASRGFNARGVFVTRAAFSKGAQAIVRIDIPDGGEHPTGEN